MTYDLRRFKHRGLISRIPGTHRYRVTDLGLDTAKIPHHRPRPHPDHRLGRTRHHTTNPKPLRTAATSYRKAVDTLCATA